MLRQLMQYIGCRSNGIGTQIKFQTRFFGSGNETVSCGFVAGDVHIASGRFYFTFNLISMCNGCMGVMSVVVSGADNLDIGFCNFGFLGKFLAYEVFGYFQVAVEQPTHQPHCEHIAAFQHGFVVHTSVGKAVFYHFGDRSGNDILLDSHFFNGIVCLESRLFQIRLLECICINDDTCGRFGKLILRFQCCSVHSYQHIAFVTGGIDFLCTDVHLKTGYACQRTLRCADVCRIVRECADVITYRSPNC